MLDIKKHTQCHKRFLSLLPSKYQSEDSNKLAIAYFSLASLELLGTLDSTFPKSELQSFIDYIYMHLIETEEYSGFRGSLTYNCSETSIELASTCFALQCLLILRDDLSRVNKAKIMNFVKTCQVANGGFANTLNSDHDRDLRYCMIATTMSKILLEHFTAIKTYINVPALTKYIHDLQTYDGGFAMRKGDESHGGMVFCAVDALSLIADDPHTVLEENVLRPLLRFLVHRQIYFGKYNQLEFEQNVYADLDDNGGFNGRLNKYGDTCYVFWALGSLQLLGFANLVNKEEACMFLITKTQNYKMGGFNKTTDCDEMPDPLHSFLGLAALSILDYPGIGKLNCRFVVPQSCIDSRENLK